MALRAKHTAGTGGSERLLNSRDVAFGTGPQALLAAVGIRV
jgi:hypothetical protein